MREFSERIKNFDNIRDYMREFYIYGFKSRNYFTRKSLRTYDNEKRRIESYMGSYMRWRYDQNKKKSFICIDCAKLATNPLYAAWKSKSFTNNDIHLHFYILDVLQNRNSLTIEEITNRISETSGIVFDIQTVRNKCKEYIENGLLVYEKKGKTFYYSLTKIYFEDIIDLSDAIAYFQGVSLLGEVGSFMLDNENIENDVFRYKHLYIAHTLDDEILLQILKAIRKKQMISFINRGKRETVSSITAIPIKIFISALTGRRYICVYLPKTKRFFNYRLDNIKAIKILPTPTEDISVHTMLERNLDRVWGVNFGRSHRIEMIMMKLYIDEQKEKYILYRIQREGKGGTLTKIEDNIFLYQKEVFDSNDISPWLKTFMGRILELEGTNQSVIKRFYEDIERLTAMYEEEEYSCYYNVIAQILEQAQTGITKAEIETLVEENAFYDSTFHLLPMLFSNTWSFLEQKGDLYFSKVQSNINKRPLTILEQEWLKALLCDEKISLFIDEDKQKELGALLEDVDPLFEPTQIHIFDEVLDKDLYSDKKYIQHFRMLLEACKKHTVLRITYQAPKNERTSNFCFLPYKLIYSQKDNKFRASGVFIKNEQKYSKRILLNLSRIESISLDTTKIEDVIEEIYTHDTKTQSITIKVFKQRNALERFMLQFASWEKETTYNEEENCYYCHVVYDKADGAELIIRVLSFGPTIKILGPTSFVKQVKDRIRKQKNLNCLLLHNQ
jgi:predicted DNA-binding transcriptional regulator YafY